MEGWHFEIYHPGTLKLESRSGNYGPDRERVFRHARKAEGGLIRVVERRPGTWIYHYRSGRKVGAWNCPEVG